MIIFRIKDGEAERIAERMMPNEQKMAVVARYCHEQTKDRFSTSGASGSSLWPAPKWLASVGKPDGRRLLTGRTGSLLQSFFSYSTEDSAILASDSPYAHVQQLGTVGKGGQLPDIKPVKARALFIPLTDRAATSERISGPPAMQISRIYGRASLQPMRYATRGQIGAGGFFKPLIRGQLVNGKVEPPNSDFLLLKKVAIAPRGMLPDSPSEQAAQRALIVDVLQSRT